LNFISIQHNSLSRYILLVPPIKAYGFFVHSRKIVVKVKHIPHFS